jgi:hypothetical protein
VPLPRPWFFGAIHKYRRLLGAVPVAAELARVVTGDRERSMLERSAGSRPETPHDPKRDLEEAAPISWLPVDTYPGKRTPIIFTWDIASSHGWGTYGLNLALSWAEDPDLLPIGARGFNQSDVAIDRLRQQLLTSTVKNTQSLEAALAPLRGCAATVPFPGLHGLENFVTLLKSAYDVALRGSVNIGVIFLEDTTIDWQSRERAKLFSLLVAGNLEQTTARR